MSEGEMQDPFALLKPDWAKWEAEEKGRLWHAVALACNYDPRNFKFLNYPELSRLNGAYPQDFTELLALARNNLGGSLKAVSINKSWLQESEVLFSTFGAWLESIGYEAPTEFPWRHGKEEPITENTSITGDAPLKERERTTLLTLIAALCDHARLDITKPSKAASVIEDLTSHIGARVAARTIEEHLKRIPAALQKRAP